MASGTVILLNGSSSSGKTTLAKALQHALREPLQHIALDHFRDGMPDRIRGLNSPAGTPGASGLNVVPRSVDGEALTHIEFGDVGEKVLKAMRRSVLALAEEGVCVVVDDLLFKPAYLQDYATLLEPVTAYLVGVRCPLEVVEDREAQRSGRFPGTARSHFHSIHGHGADYDLEVDTSRQPPEVCAAQVVRRLAEPPTALPHYRGGSCGPLFQLDPAPE